MARVAKLGKAVVAPCACCKVLVPSANAAHARKTRAALIPAGRADMAPFLLQGRLLQISINGLLRLAGGAHLVEVETIAF